MNTMKQTFYRQPHQVVIPDNGSTKCDCGESSCLHIHEFVTIITCDACFENAAWHHQMNDCDIVYQFGDEVDEATYYFWNETYYINHDLTLSQL
jgi:hypothetical protein